MATAAQPMMEIPEILKQFERDTGPFPFRAVEAAVARREEIIPELLRILEETLRTAEAQVVDAYNLAHFYAAFLLAQFREPRAYPLLVNLLSAPAGAVDDLFDYFLTEDAAKVLASLSSGDLGPMMALAENEQANEWARGAALRGMVTLVVAGLTPRETVTAYFASLFRAKLPREPGLIWEELVGACLHFYPEELLRDIEQAYQEDLVDEAFVAWSDVRQVMSQGMRATLEQTAEDRHFQLVEDTAAEMSGWACFEPAHKTASASRPSLEPRRTVGRNDPCPCGSGKKHNKCCAGIERR